MKRILNNLIEDCAKNTIIKGKSEFPLASVSKQVFMRNHSNENEFDLHENGREGGTHFHVNDFTRRLVLKERQRVTRKWPIAIISP